MADFGSPVAQGVDPNKGIQTLSGLLGLKQQQQSLQTGQYQQQYQQAAAINAQQGARETQAGAQLLSDPIANGILDADGNPRKEAQSIIMQAMPTTGAQHYADIVKAAQSKVELNNSLNNLRSNERSEIASTIAGVAADPKSSIDDVNANVQALVDSKKGTPLESDYKTIGDISLGILKKVNENKSPIGFMPDNGQEPWRIAAFGLGRSILPATGIVGSGGIATPERATMTNGATIQPGVSAPALQGGGFTPQGAAIPVVTPPQNAVGGNGQLMHVGAGGAGLPGPGGGQGTPASPVASPFKSPQGQVWTSANTQPPPNAPAPTQKAYAEAVAQAQTDVTNARMSDKDYGINMSLADNIRHLSADTKTGPGTETWNRVMGTLGSRVGANNIANYQQLNAFLENQASRLQASMGLPSTNAGLGAAQSIGGNVGFQPAAIAAKNDYLQALVEGNHQYRAMMDRVEGFTGNPNPQAVQAAQSAWKANFDPRVYEGEMAFARSPEEGKKFMATLSPKEAQLLRIKRQNLQQLSNGQMPQ